MSIEELAEIIAKERRKNAKEHSNFTKMHNILVTAYNALAKAQEVQADSQHMLKMSQQTLEETSKKREEAHTDLEKLIKELAESQEKFQKDRKAAHADIEKSIKELTEAQKEREETHTDLKKSIKELVDSQEKFQKDREAAHAKIEASIEKLVEEHNQFSVELREFKEENHIRFKKQDEEFEKYKEENRAYFKKKDEEFEKFKKENRAIIKKLNKSQQRNENLFNTQWGRLVEALVKNQVIPLLQNRGIPVERINQRVEIHRNGYNNEFDIVAENSDTKIIVIVEVKTTLQVNDVKEFLGKLAQAKIWFPEYLNYKVYGAVAFLHDVSQSPVYAEKHGLFTILATGSGAMITNPEEFQPREF